MIAAADWYETIPFADGVTLIHEPWITPYFRCNMWLIEGRERSLLIDAGLGAAPLRANVPLLRGREVTLLLSHTHFDHIGGAAEFAGRLVHAAEAAVAADPAPRETLFANYADGARDAEMFDAPPEGWDATRHAIAPAPATGLVADGDRIELGGRALTVLHTPGHSPGHVALFEERTGTLFAQDAVYDGPLVDGLFHSDVPAYCATMRRLRELAPRIVHGGHYPSFGPTHFRRIIDAYLARNGRA